MLIKLFPRRISSKPHMPHLLQGTRLAYCCSLCGRRSCADRCGCRLGCRRAEVGWPRRPSPWWTPAAVRRTSPRSSRLSRTSFSRGSCRSTHSRASSLWMGRISRLLWWILPSVLRRILRKALLGLIELKAIVFFLFVITYKSLSRNKLIVKVNFWLF